jgi:hypothetical protein
MIVNFNTVFVEIQVVGLTSFSLISFHEWTYQWWIHSLTELAFLSLINDHFLFQLDLILLILSKFIVLITLEFLSMIIWSYYILVHFLIAFLILDDPFILFSLRSRLLILVLAYLLFFLYFLIVHVFILTRVHALICLPIVPGSEVPPLILVP